MLPPQYQNRILIVRLFFVEPDDWDDIIGNRVSDRLHLHFATLVNPYIWLAISLGF